LYGGTGSKLPLLLPPLLPLLLLLLEAVAVGLRATSCTTACRLK
jgi:hypothetical protein